jgi:hypothetical protein
MWCYAQQGKRRKECILAGSCRCVCAINIRVARCKRINYLQLRRDTRTPADSTNAKLTCREGQHCDRHCLLLIEAACMRTLAAQPCSPTLVNFALRLIHWELICEPMTARRQQSVLPLRQRKCFDTADCTAATRAPSDHATTNARRR